MGKKKKKLCYSVVTHTHTYWTTTTNRWITDHSTNTCILLSFSLSRSLSLVHSLSFSLSRSLSLVLSRFFSFSLFLHSNAERSQIQSGSDVLSTDQVPAETARLLQLGSVSLKAVGKHKK